MQQAGIMPHLLLQQMRAAKGGVIGTAGKGVIALRFDDMPHLFAKKVLPLLKELGLPCSIALLSRFDRYYRDQNVGWEDIHAFIQCGVEVWSHSVTHADPSPDGYAGLYREIVTSKEEIARHGIKVMGFVLPGTEQLTAERPYNGLSSLEDYNSDAGRLIMEHYAISDAYAVGSIRPLPFGLYHGLGHFTCSDGEPLERTLERIDHVAKYRRGLEILCHPNSLDREGNLTSDGLRTVLEKIAGMWQAGEIEVLTPSGLCFADASTDYRLDLLQDGDFTAPIRPGLWQMQGQAVQHTDGLCLAPGASIRQQCPDLRTQCLSGEPFLLEVEAGADAPGVQLTLSVQDATPSRLSRSRTVTLGEAKTYRMPFGLSQNTNTLEVSLTCQGGACTVKHVRVLKI
nr:polysaccharide deacetylase family protein [bacterium]